MGIITYGHELGLQKQPNNTLILPYKLDSQKCIFINVL